jgi:hypothetical protein
MKYYPAYKTINKNTGEEYSDYLSIGLLTEVEAQEIIKTEKRLEKEGYRDNINFETIYWIDVNND